MLKNHFTQMVFFTLLFLRPVIGMIEADFFSRLEEGGKKSVDGLTLERLFKLDDKQVNDLIHDHFKNYCGEKALKLLSFPTFSSELTEFFKNAYADLLKNPASPFRFFRMRLAEAVVGTLTLKKVEENFYHMQLDLKTGEPSKKIIFTGLDKFFSQAHKDFPMRIMTNLRSNETKKIIELFSSHGYLGSGTIFVPATPSQRALEKDPRATIWFYEQIELSGKVGHLEVLDEKIGTWRKQMVKTW